MTESDKPRRYGQWAGNPAGHPEDPALCAEEVYDRIASAFYQCRRKRGHGPGEEYCKQHANLIEKYGRKK